MPWRQGGRASCQAVAHLARRSRILQGGRGLALFSSLYFSSAITSGDRLFGTIGVIFILLPWCIAVGDVIA
jgi:hypothetical protein